MIFGLGLVVALLQTGAAGVAPRRDSTPEIYFRASLSRGSTIGLGSNVRFDQVRFQIGKCYNPTTGVFTAPVADSTEKDLKELTDRVHSEQNRSALLIDELKAAQKEMSSTQSQLSQVTNVVKSHSGNLMSAQSEVLSLQKNFQSSQAEVASLSSDVDKLKSNLSGILHMYAIDSYALSSLADNLDRLKEDVAFEVTLSSQSGPTTVPNGYAIKFDSVPYNVGNGYNKLTGIFTAPVSGTYIFWVNVVYRNHGSALDIYIRSSKFIIGIGYGRRVQSQDGTVVANTVANIDKGESVWFTPSVNLDVVDWLSSFGGALLRVH